MNKDYLKGGQREAGRTEPGAVEGASEASQRPSGTLEAGVLFDCSCTHLVVFFMEILKLNSKVTLGVTVGLQGQLREI